MADNGFYVSYARGEAADIRYDSKSADKTLCCAAKCGAGFGLDERKHRTPKTRGDNIHIQTPPGRLGGRGDLPDSCVGGPP